MTEIALGALARATTFLSALADRTTPRSPRALVSVVLRYRRVVVAVLHVVLIGLSTYLAFWLRFEGAIPSQEATLLRQILPVLVVVRGLIFIPFGLYEGLWRYTGIWDLRNIIAGVGTSTVLFALLCRLFGVMNYPRSVLVVDPILLVFLMGGIRLTRRAVRELMPLKREKRVLIFGAGDAGEMIVREMRQRHDHEYEPVGFVDDDPTKLGHRIHGLPVLGAQQDLPELIAKYRPQEVLVAIPRADPSAIRRVVTAMEPFKVPIKTLPRLGDIVNGTVTVSQIRGLAIEDLLPRAPVGLDPQPLHDLITNKRVLVTGAGGSIGSELCRQIAALQPAVLLMFERYENGLYTVANDLADRHPQCRRCSILGDVTDVRRLNLVLAEHQPDIVFHAAAHKHVPLTELNPCEAVKNNVIGTRLAAEAAERHGVELFILISSDKAVNPTSVMGATKRVAELILQRLSAQSATRFVTVRFGNVLGSNGSVVPRFIEQIKTGGPVTVTHPDMRRYFMLISEAVQLVLHAAALGERGGAYVLEMGEQIKLLDLARNVIRLSGYIPDEEIPITYIGLRPGEKLSEQLAGDNETIEPSPIPKILRVRSSAELDRTLLAYHVAKLERFAARSESAAVIHQLCAIVPTFSPSVESTEGQPVSRAVAARQSRRRAVTKTEFRFAVAPLTDVRRPLRTPG